MHSLVEQYNDDEGDRVILTTVSDLTAAIEHAKSAGWKVIVVTLFFQLTQPSDRTSLHNL
jgi:hypothetical protein